MKGVNASSVVRLVLLIAYMTCQVPCLLVPLFFGKIFFPESHRVNKYIRSVLSPLSTGVYLLFCSIRLAVQLSRSIPRHRKNHARFLLMTHSSTLDFMVVTTASWLIHDVLGGVVCIVKRELLSMPFIGWIQIGAGSVPVARSGDADAAKRNLAIAETKIQDGYLLAGFPEGSRRRTRSSGRDQLLPFKKGMFHIAKNVADKGQESVEFIPLVMVGGNTAWPSNYLLPIPGSKVVVRVGDPIRMQKNESVDEMTVRVRECMSSEIERTGAVKTGAYSIESAFDESKEIDLWRTYGFEALLMMVPMVGSKLFLDIFSPTSEQELAINCPVSDHCIVRAGPGSGKTFFLVHRVLKLVQETDEKIYCFTFTNEAARELKRRLAGFNVVGTRVGVSTIHKFCLDALSSGGTRMKVLKNKNQLISKLATVFTEEDRKVLMGYDPHQVNNRGDSGEVTDGSESGKENEDISLNIDLEMRKYLSCVLDAIRHYSRSGDCGHPHIQVLADRYTHSLSTEGLIDMGLIVSEFLSKFDFLKSYIESAGKYFLVDEFQDLDSEQLKLVQLLMDGGKIFTAVGDVNQSIYGWRTQTNGKRMRVSDSGNQQLFTFSLNLRSCETLVRISNRLVDARNVAAASGGMARVFRCKTEMDQLVKVSWMIKQLGDSRWTSLAVLFRMNCDKERFLKILERHNVPYHGRSTTRVEKKITKSLSSLLSVCRGLTAEKSEDWISSLMNWAPEKSQKKISDFLSGNGIKTEEPVGETEGKLKEVLRSGSSRDLTTKALISDYMSKLNRVRKIGSVVDQLGAICSEFKIQKTKDITDFRAVVVNARNLQEALKLYEESNAVSQTAQGVYVGTIHSAKGREWKTVFLPLIDEGIFPSERADIGEERRVLYVAITRAIQAVVLTCGPKPSLFISDLSVRSTFSASEVVQDLIQLS